MRSIALALLAQEWSMILLNANMADNKSPIYFLNLLPILEETYGVIVYQEQVMKIASAIGGYSLG